MIDVTSSTFNLASTRQRLISRLSPIRERPANCLQPTSAPCITDGTSALSGTIGSSGTQIHWHFPIAAAFETTPRSSDIPEVGRNTRVLKLQSMRERAAAVGGTLEIQSAPGEGTRLRARFPLAAHICG